MVLTVIEHGYMIPINSNQVIEDGAVATARKLMFSETKSTANLITDAMFNSNVSDVTSITGWKSKGWNEVTDDYRRRGGGIRRIGHHGRPHGHQPAKGRLQADRA
jgi:hypothetical protein